MSPPTTRSEPRWGQAAALILLGGGGVAAWWGDLGSGMLWLAPVIWIAALTAAGRLDPRSAAILAVIWVPASLLAAGLPASALTPAALGATVTSLREGVQALPNVDTATPVIQTWALAAVLLIAGVTAIVAGILWKSSRRDLTLLGFALLLVPLAGAIAWGQTPDSPWPGALVIAAVVVRFARGRLVPILAATSLVGAIALFGAQVAAPRAGWQPWGHGGRSGEFHEFVTRQSYGPLEGRRTGAVMLDITAQPPALWRMQVLESFDSRRWRVANEDTYLPEPAARTRTFKVVVRGLHNRLVTSTGQIVSVRGAGHTVGELGDTRVLVTRPSSGTTYYVKVSAVHATSAQLAGIPVPTGSRYFSTTQIGLEPLSIHVPSPLAKLAGHVPPSLRGTDWARLLSLSSRLSNGVPNELGVVRNVEDYLLESGRFHYTTDVGTPGAEPLLEFLFHTHAGYCQHFAGAAALLLRVAGVPTRVAVGFATGEQIGKHTWAVRDVDAHAWIEVYFPTVGWVPFNPTPSSAQADIASGIDILEPTVTQAGSGGTVPELAAVAVALILLIAAGLRLRSRHAPRTQLADLLTRLSPQPPGPRTTLRSLHPTLTELGPATADLAFVAERARFGSDRSAEPPHPRLAVWRALVADVGFPRALGLMLRAARPA